MKKFSIQKTDSSQKTYYFKAMLTSHLRKKTRHDKSCADYKNKVFVENAWDAVDKEMGFKEGKEYSYFLCRMKFKRRTSNIFY